MIIQRRGGDLLLIRQCDHAALAADIMAGWEPGGLPGHPRRDAILTAAREHDTGWQEEDDVMHLREDGTPLDFMTIPAAVKRRIWPRAVARLSSRSPYIAALVAEHALTIYRHVRDEPAWQSFFRDMVRARDEHLARASPEEAAGARAEYAFVRTGDLLSLMFCNGWTGPQSGPGYSAILAGITLEIRPDPFAGRRVPLRVPARLIPARAYRSREDLQQACAGASVVALEGEAAGA